MSGRGKERERTGDISNRVERLEMGGFAGDLSHIGAFLGTWIEAGEGTGWENPEKGKISWDRKK